MTGSNAITTCGTNTWLVTYRVTTPASWDGKRFGIALGGTPGTGFFSQSPAKAGQLLSSLTNLGYRMVEIRYASNAYTGRPSTTVDGFYGIACGQGLPAMFAHCAQIYDLMVTAAGYSSKDPTHRLIGVGYSLGGMQLMAAAFVKNRRFDRLAITGITQGDQKTGCIRGQQNIYDGYSYTGQILVNADLVTSSKYGCSLNAGNPIDYNGDNNFENLPYHNKWNLGLFEGDDHFDGGHDSQASYVFQNRGGGPTSLIIYPGAGHGIWGESVSSVSTLLEDHVAYLTR